MDPKTFIAVIALIISAVASFTSIFLNIRATRESNRLAKASRRTLALNCLSDEELALLRVRTECESLHLLIRSSIEALGDQKDHLLSEATRIVGESRTMLADVRKKRTLIENKIERLSAAEIEGIIAESYQGRIQAESQLSRTTRSRDDTIRLYLNERKS